LKFYPTGMFKFTAPAREFLNLNDPLHQIYYRARL